MLTSQRVTGCLHATWIFIVLQNLPIKSSRQVAYLLVSVKYRTMLCGNSQAACNFHAMQHSLACFNYVRAVWRPVSKKCVSQPALLAKTSWMALIIGVGPGWSASWSCRRRRRRRTCPCPDMHAGVPNKSVTVSLVYRHSSNPASGRYERRGVRKGNGANSPGRYSERTI